MRVGTAEAAEAEAEEVAAAGAVAVEAELPRVGPLAMAAAWKA